MINIYKASAGSGKTFTLAREYIKLLLGRKDEAGNYHLRKSAWGSHRSVLAITFTNKATEEMKIRIIHELAVIAGLEKGWTKPSPYEADLCAAFRCTPADLKEAAATALRSLLYDFNFFSVSTIDSFFQLILRSFAREAEVSGNYELELDDKGVIGMSVDKLLQDLNHGEQTARTNYLVNWLSNYMTHLIEDGRTFNIFNRSSYIHRDLISFINDITDDVFRENESRLMEYFSDEKKFDNFKTHIYNLIGRITRQTAEACGAAVQAIDGRGAKEIISSNVYKPLLKWMQSGYDSKGLSATMMKVADDIGAAYLKKGKDSPLRTPELDGLISAAVTAMDFCATQVRTLKIIAANLYQLGLLSTLTAYLDKFRQENSTILLSDTNALIAKIIGSEDAPFLYERVGIWFKHYLIDEFQDTSHSQWQNIRPLISESLAYDNDNLVIGDEKQCIYRFRNSDPTLLHNLHTEKMAQGRTVISGDSIKENTNWRSSADVIRFNNTFFSALVRNLGYGEIYSNVAQQISPKHLGHKGYVRVKVYSGSKKEEWMTEALDNLTAELRRQLSSGYRPGDIAILVRRWDEGNAVISHLEEVRKAEPDFPEFRIVSDSSLLIGNSPAVSLIISRLRLLSSTDFSTNPRKKTQREIANLINRFESLRSDGNLSPAEALDMALRSEETTDTIPPREENTTQPAQSPTSIDLVSLVENIIANFVPEENRRTENLYLTAFQDLVTEFVSRGHGDIRAFLRWWDESGNKSAVAGAKDDSALNILTIHKSKGLEYPCVHIPFAQMNSGSHSELAWFEIDSIPGIPDDCIPPMIPLKLSSSMEGTVFGDRYAEVTAQSKLDTVNLLYVAFTRAVDELHIGITSPEAKGASIGPDIYEALGMCSQTFCNELEEANGITDRSRSPFTSFTLADNLITIGQPSVKAAEEHSEKTSLTPARLLNVDSYDSQLHRSFWDNTHLEEKYYNIEDARDRGIMLHDTMADIRTAADVPVAINNLRHSKKAKELTEADIEEIRPIIEARVKDPRVSRWFSGYNRLLIERPIVVSTTESRRPDRVVWTADNHIDIIDFKSGSQPAKKYHRQLTEYVRLLSGLGYENLRAYLYYLDSGEIVEIHV